MAGYSGTGSYEYPPPAQQPAELNPFENPGQSLEALISEAVNNVPPQQVSFTLTPVQPPQPQLHPQPHQYVPNPPPYQQPHQPHHQNQPAQPQHLNQFLKNPQDPLDLVFRPEGNYFHKLTQRAAHFMEHPGEISKVRYSGREAWDFGTPLLLPDVLRTTEMLFDMARQPWPCAWRYNEAAIASCVVETYYRFLRNADLDEFNQVIEALELDKKHVKPAMFRSGVRSKITELVNYAVKHRNFKNFFVFYFAPSINKWV